MDKANYVIISEATSDLAPELARQADVHIIPMPVGVEEDSYLYSPIPEDGNIDTETFYALQKAGKSVHTSQINGAVYNEVFQKYLQEGYDILYIGFSSGLSNSVLAGDNCLKELAQQYPDRRMYCVDSLSASVGEGMLLYAAAKKRQAGMDIDTLYAWVEENKLHFCHWFTVDDLSYLRRGGRISATSATLGTVIQIKPVMHVDNEGHLINVAKAHGRKKAMLAMAEMMQKTWLPDADTTVFIGHGACPEDAEALRQMVLQRCPRAEITIMPIGPIIGAHSGVGTLALFFFGTER
ncbi:MAG: DegV family protein [Firmicutes bacterium]|nr:DegV family protein [Bacillota bacterium]